MSRLADGLGQSNETPRPRYRAMDLYALFAKSLVANRHAAVPRWERGSWLCQTCDHGVNQSSRNGGRSFWRHNPKTFSRKEAPRFPF
jgi:hypothetical protein